MRQWQSISDCLLCIKKYATSHCRPCGYWLDREMGLSSLRTHCGASETNLHSPHKCTYRDKTRQVQKVALPIIYSIIYHTYYIYTPSFTLLAYNTSYTSYIIWAYFSDNLLLYCMCMQNWMRLRWTSRGEAATPACPARPMTGLVAWTKRPAGLSASSGCWGTPLGCATSP